ncbi:hypothetical protein [Tuwongella immobilis]|uniref:Uncharacterized protein n=1 Tax=Tuwongella immobilis TaxID=692036 RepID=A0A6C2YQJ2_9BACT|nr:hypothetical protein [Tuwongella immobilis]VIP03910.1 unnamed protein product [Tuwongella immobilis]VTS05187.1 unnamed protein product [Tuwongella immobilis]
MEKGLCFFALGVAGALLLVFLLDLFVGFPFSSNTPPDKSSPFVLVDIAGIIAAGIVGYLGFNSLRDIR